MCVRYENEDMANSHVLPTAKFTIIGRALAPAQLLVLSTQR